MASTPQFVGTPQVWQAQLTTANTNRDGTGTLATLVTGQATPGTRIDKIRTVAAGNTTAGVVRFYLDDGTNKRLIKERLVTAVTPSTTVAVYEDEFDIDVVLPTASWSIKASTHNAETFNIFAKGGNL